MKQTFKKAMMPLAVVVLGAAAAFATNAAKQSEKIETAAMQGYYYDHNETQGNRCKPITVDCKVGPGAVCTDFVLGQIWALDVETETTCSTYLSRL